MCSDTGYRSSDRTVTLLIFSGVLALYLAVTRGEISAYDAQSMAAVARNLVDHGSLTTTGAFNDGFGFSTPYSPYGIAVSLLAALAYVLSKVVGHAGLLTSLINPSLMATATAIVFLVCRSLSWNMAHALTAAIGFGVFTMALQSTTELLSEPGVTLCVVAMVFSIIRWGQGWRWAPLMVGLSAAAAIQFRSDSVLTVCIGLLAIPLFVPWRTLIGPSAVVLLTGPLVVSLGFLAWYNHLRFGTLITTSYNAGGFTTPLGLGLRGLLLSPGKGLFVFNPLAALGVVGLLLLVWRNWALALLFGLLIVPRLLFYAKWSSWEGGWSWGPRFLLPMVPLLMIASVEVLRALERRSAIGILVRGSALLLVVASVSVNFLSIRVPYEQWYMVLSTPALRAQVGDDVSLGPPVAPGSTSYMDSYEFNIAAGPLRGNVLLLQHDLAGMGPRWWREGHNPLLGVLLIFVGVGCIALAALQSWRWPSEPPKDEVISSTASVIEPVRPKVKPDEDTATVNATGAGHRL